MLAEAATTGDNVAVGAELDRVAALPLRATSGRKIYWTSTASSIQAGLPGADAGETSLMKSWPTTV